MLTLQLTLDNAQVTVRANERQSHTFSLHDLNVDLKNFVKDPRPYGGKLFQALFKDGTSARKAFEELSKQIKRKIVLVLEASELDGVAWEYAYHDNAYVVEDYSFIRVLPEKERPHSNGHMTKSVERLPLLFIPANPLVDLSGEPMRELDIESEWREMTQHIVKSNAPFDMIDLRPATPAALQSVMARFQNGMIAHFSGHGAATKDGVFLLFENENGSSNPLEAREFVREVKDQAWIGFLSACQSAVAERTAYGNLARELVKAGVPFALGMQFNLPDPFAPNISGQFYNYLSQGHAVPDAARQARRAVKRENEFYVGMIALYAAHPDEAGKIGWTGSGARTLSTFAAADVSDLPIPSGFIGRQRELMNIGTSLLGKKKPNTITLHGAGGIGKTALMRQLLLRFASSFEVTLAIALDPLPSLESVVGRVERFLNLPSPCANDTKEREQIVRGKLTGRDTLLGLDNFETLIHARDNGSDEEKKTAKSLYAFFKSLAAEGVTLCVTSREKTSLPGEIIQEIRGLKDEVGGRLFQNTVSTRRDALNEEGLEKISAAVGGHPLALRLLAPIFEEQAGLSLEGFIKKLQTFLPEATDQWTDEERHASLNSCFAFSVDNLQTTNKGKELKNALTRLSIFSSYFFSIIAAEILENRGLFSDDILDRGHKAENMLHSLWEYGLLERLSIPLTDQENLNLYRAHPVLQVILKDNIADTESIRNLYQQAVSDLLLITESQMRSDPVYVQIAKSAMPDFLFVAKTKNDKEGALYQLTLGKIMEFLGLWDDAESILELSKINYQSLADPHGEASALIGLGTIKQLRGNYTDALRQYQKALELADQLDSLDKRAVIIGNIGQIYYSQGNVDRGLALQREKHKIIQSTGNKLEEAKVQNDLANISIQTGDIESALASYEQAAAIARDGYDQIMLAYININKARALKAQKNMSEALQLLDEALAICNDFEDLRGVAHSLQTIAEIHLFSGEVDMAMDLFQQTVKISERIGAQSNKSNALAWMAMAYYQNGENDKALVVLRESLSVLDSMDEPITKVERLVLLAEILASMERTPDAILELQRALDIQDKLGNQNNKANLQVFIADCHASMGDWESAKTWLVKSIEIYEDTKDLYGKASVLARLGQLLILGKEYTQGIESLLDSCQLFISMDNRIALQEVITLLSQSGQEILKDPGTSAELRELVEVIQYRVDTW